MAFRIVDFPLPFGPSSPTNWPSLTARSMPVTMRRPARSTRQRSSLQAHCVAPYRVGAAADGAIRVGAPMNAVITPIGISCGQRCAGQQVAHDHEAGAEQHADRQHPAVIGADHEADDVRDDQADEADHPADRDRDPGHQRGDQEQVPAQPGHVHAQRRQAGSAPMASAFRVRPCAIR